MYFSYKDSVYNPLTLLNYVFSVITEKIIPFFNKYPLQGIKLLDFLDFNQVAKLIENKIHLTSEGFEQIKQIKLGTNKGRSSKVIYSQKRTYVTTKNCNNITSQNFNEWLSGLIDGDGNFFVSKKINENW